MAMSHRGRWLCLTALAFAVWALQGCGGAGPSRSSAGHRPPARRPPVEITRSSAVRALARWRGFAAHANPRPVILTGEGSPRRPQGGFPSRADLAAFLTGRYTLRARLPRGPAVVDGYRVVSAGAAYRTLARRIPGHRARPHGRLTIRAVRPGHGVFPTDRGSRRLPAWQFFFAGIRHPAKVLAVTPAEVFAAPVPRQLTKDASPYPGSPVIASSDGRTLTVSFIGARAGSQPCDASYSVDHTGDRHAVAITVVEHPARIPAPAHTICPAVGYPRSATIHLAAPLGPRALVSALSGTVITVRTENPKRLTIGVTGGDTERAELGSYCLPAGHSSYGCADVTFDPSPPGHLSVYSKDLLFFDLGAAPTSLTVRLAHTVDRRHVSYSGGPLRGGLLGGANRWYVQLPNQLGHAHIVDVFVRYRHGDASFEAGIRPRQGQRPR